MAIRQYSLNYDGEKYVSKNFRVREFACKDGTDKILIDDALVTLVQSVRVHFGKPVIVNSAYRTVKHNKLVGGSPTSKHLKGTAADIKVRGVSPDKVYEYVRKTFKWAGVGRYDTFTHVDAGPPRTWDYRTKK